MHTIFHQTCFFLRLFCLPSVLPAENFPFAHKTAGCHDGESLRNVLWNNLPYFRHLVPILFGVCSNLPALSTKNIGRSLLAIVVAELCCCKFCSLCYCWRRSWLGLVSSPFLRWWGVISCPFLHYRMFLPVLLLRLISRRGGEGMCSRPLLLWFVGARRRSGSIRGTAAVISAPIVDAPILDAL